jgi:Ser/Thr protein kinase RdoA (MazF antagonist)
MINSERIAEILGLRIPAIPAKIISGKYVHRYKEQYYMIYDWLDGKSIFPPEIKGDHCIAIGEIIGKIHSINISLQGVADEGDVSTIFEWRKFLDMANEIKATWAREYEQAIENIIHWNQKVLNAKAILSKEKIISHRDLDPKNVMWQGNRPFIIDWEAAGYVNPYQELLEIINYWADDGSGSLHKNRCLAILDSYKRYKNLNHVNWDMVLDTGYDGMLGWLEYNVKRALGIEVSCREEITLGEQQVISTITELRSYQVKRKLLKEWLSKDCKVAD